MTKLAQKQSDNRVGGKYQIGYLYNAKSGKNRRTASELSTEQIESRREFMYRRVTTLLEINAAISEFIEASVPLIIVHAGDGTVQAVLTQVIARVEQEQRPVLALLPGGTTNMTYGDVGWHGDVDDLLRRGLAWAEKRYFGLSTQRRTIMRMHASGLTEPVCGMFFGAGIIHSGILYCRQNIHTKGVRGEWGPGLAAVKLLFDWVFRKGKVRSIPVHIQSDEQAFDDSAYTLIAISTLHRLFLGLQPFWNETSENKLRYTFIDDQAKQLWRVLPRILRGLVPREGQEGYLSGSAEKLVMNFSGGFTLDGQLFGSEDVSTKVELSAAGSIEFLRYD